MICKFCRCSSRRHFSWLWDNPPESWFFKSSEDIPCATWFSDGYIFTFTVNQSAFINHVTNLWKSTSGGSFRQVIELVNWFLFDKPLPQRLLWGSVRHLRCRMRFASNSRGVQCASTVQLQSGTVYVICCAQASPEMCWNGVTLTLKINYHRFTTSNDNGFSWMMITPLA